MRKKSSIRANILFHLYASPFLIFFCGLIPKQVLCFGEGSFQLNKSWEYQHAYTSEWEGSAVPLLTCSLNSPDTEHAQWHHPIPTARNESSEDLECIRKWHVVSCHTGRWDSVKRNSCVLYAAADVRVLWPQPSGQLKEGDSKNKTERSK